MEYQPYSVSQLIRISIYSYGNNRWVQRREGVRGLRPSQGVQKKFTIQINVLFRHILYGLIKHLFLFHRNIQCKVENSQNVNNADLIFLNLF